MGDQELLDALRRTPEQGMAALMEQYAGLVYAVVKRRLPGDLFCPADVELCAADTFSEFYLDLDKYDPGKGSIRSWLCVIARHNAQDLVRRRYRETGVIPLDGELEAAAGVVLESGLEERELRRAVLEAVRGLGEPDREIILRKYYLGERTREIAARLGLTVSNVDTRAHRAVEKLRDKLKEWG
ncbi:MAG: sigma-70 family RNA polymerase sigma factor [Clostridiales bacterium]|nr:sigma-70 family RNA polymerase sigma factor [Clostridiales bacterium]